MRYAASRLGGCCTGEVFASGWLRQHLHADASTAPSCLVGRHHLEASPRHHLHTCCSIHCLHCCHAGKCGTLLLPGWPALPSAFAASLLNQHMLTLEMPYIEQCLVVLLIILMLKGIGVMQGVLRPRIPGDEPTFVFPKIKRAFLVHVLIGTFWLGRIIIFRPFCSDFSRARPQCAYKRGGAGK